MRQTICQFVSPFVCRRACRPLSPRNFLLFPCLLPVFCGRLTYQHGGETVTGGEAETNVSWLDEVKQVLRDNGGLLPAAMGLACALVSMGGMRLNTLDGIYPVELSLVLRHLFGGIAALLVVYAYSRSSKPFVLSKSLTRFGAISALFAVSLLFRYSASLLTTTSPALVMAGKLLEEFFGVLLILAWAERILPYGFKASATCFGTAVTAFAAIQILLAFFQRVPSMFALVMLPLISAILFKVHLGARPLAEEQGAAQAAATVENAPWPVDLKKPTSMLLYYGIIFVFVFICGQLLRPSLDLQQQNMSCQLSIALGNALAGLFVLATVGQLGQVKSQPRLVFSVLFLSLFALMALALALQGYLNTVSLVAYLAISSIGIQLTTVLVWAGAFSALRRPWTPVMMVALGYSCNLFSRTVSSGNMLLAQNNPSWPMGLLTVVMLVVVFALCVLFIVRAWEPKAQPADPQDSPLNRTLAAMGEEYGLTNQESRVLAMCARGMNARAISEEMTVSLNTTKSHMRMLYAKLDVHSQRELIDLVNQRASE